MVPKLSVLGLFAAAVPAQAGLRCAAVARGAPCSPTSPTLEASIDLDDVVRLRTSLASPNTAGVLILGT